MSVPERSIPVTTEMSSDWKYELYQLEEMIGAVKLCEDISGFEELLDFFKKGGQRRFSTQFPNTANSLKDSVIAVFDRTFGVINNLPERPGYELPIRSDENNRMSFVYKDLGQGTVTPRIMRLTTGLFHLDGITRRKSEVLRAESRSNAPIQDVDSKIRRGLGDAIDYLARLPKTTFD